MIKIETEKQFYELLQKIQSYQEALNVLFWDLRTGAPKKGVDQRSKTIGILSAEEFRLKTSDEMKRLLDELSATPDLSPKTRAAVEESIKEYSKYKKIPEAEYAEYVMLQTKAESVWETAKETNDFPLFAPYLEQLVETNKKFLGYWGYEGTPYNTLLGFYEPGMTVDVLDRVFAQLREKIVPLVQNISAASKQPNADFIYGTFPAEEQKKASEFFLKELGYDFSAGRLDETIHPFQISINRSDVRVTTKYDEQDFRTAVFGTIHECGHALYEQNISEELEGTPLCSGTSYGIHESQSLFYENFIGRSFGFWKRYYETFRSFSPEQLQSVSLEDFYFAINESKPSLIRIEADELTYSLHIMIRYEIEKELFNGNLAVADLPEVWNRKYEEYLGVVPPNDAKGVLQDVHWAGGSFGYFPSYALGLLYGAQFRNAMLKDLPDLEDRIERGELGSILSWLTEKIHQHGKTKKPLQLLQEVTGEELNADHLITYLTEKYSRLYSLS
ncbi:carboxypeptidase M32 [Bacillus mangrovi]|uniref:Metal-dependent carboxypeptidase n=1 Tax=Metabacillus mangrovi TaxID=1491830 RepID=A0A7X2S1M9_9BACI|nr:carboxypeptidase M32 [Metabacillus mangrovi]MTH52112.1 carboxypeptidase M32 [Metabacillus mangrovi]